MQARLEVEQAGSSSEHCKQAFILSPASLAAREPCVCRDAKCCNILRLFPVESKGKAWGCLASHATAHRQETIAVPELRVSVETQMAGSKWPAYKCMLYQ